MSGAAEKFNCTDSTLIVKLALACAPLESATVTTYVVVLLTGNVAEPVGRVSCRPSESGSSGLKLMEDALFVVQLNVVSWPATTVCRFAESDTDGEGAGVGVGGIGGGNGAG